MPLDRGEEGGEEGAMEAREHEKMAAVEDRTRWRRGLHHKLAHALHELRRCPGSGGVMVLNLPACGGSLLAVARRRNG